MRLSWQDIDSTLAELENKEGLPDFDSLADGIGKALRSVSSTHQANSVQLRKKRLAEAKRNHKAELKTIQAKQTTEAYRMSPEGQAEQARRCKSLKNRIESNLSSGEEDDAKIDIDALILECPEDPDIVGYESDFLSVAAAKDDESAKRKAEALGPVANLQATPSIDGGPCISVSWAHGEALLADSFRVERFAGSLGERTEAISTDLVVKDADVKLGIPYRYVVTPCYKGIPGKKTTSTDPLAVCTAPVTGFKAEEAEGADSFGSVKLVWTNPPWDEKAQVEMFIVREDGRSWEVSGKDAFDDENVIAGESYTYSLEVTVSGKRLDPVQCKVTVERIAKPTALVDAFIKMQDGRPRLSVPNWPEGINEIVISRPGLEPRYWSHEDNRTESFYFHSLEEVDVATIQAVRRFCGKHEVRGPASHIGHPKAARILFVSIGSRKKSFWSHEHGVTVRLDDGLAIPSLVVTIKRPNGGARSFPVASGKIVPGEFFPFPADWDAKCKDDVEISVEEASHCGKVIVRYRTSKTLP